MHRNRNGLFAAMGAALVLIVATACTEQQESQPSAEAAVCTSVAALGTALQDFRDLDPATASIDDVQAARDEIQAAWDKVTAEAVDLDEADEAAVQDALDGVFQSIDEFPTDEPIEDGLASVQDATGDVQTANQEMADGLGCNVEQ
jgi:gamma-glutamyl:cysteine ligase YbdK (ATP-grasp superfamily)